LFNVSLERLGKPDLIYNAHGHKLRSPAFEKAQFVTALGIVDGLLRIIAGNIRGSILQEHSRSIARAYEKGIHRLLLPFDICRIRFGSRSQSLTRQHIDQKKDHQTFFEK